ncbi:MAG: sulfite exporter TauE/SafE family protein [Thermoflavifilum sp.]|nr:sulfite exporter TauE/SafE family protein [Thermoflavifilum sp.]MCL6514708.1 cytochrome c biogenesis protein CcdA [Alicyclobacillus sp.]
MHPTAWLAFAAGFLSFFSPCSLPLYPSYLSYMSGVAAGASDAPADVRRRLILHGLVFVAGVSVVFFALGLSATLLGQLFSAWRAWIRVVGGLLVVLMGAFLAGLVPAPWLLRERRWHPASRDPGLFTSLLLGLSFAAGWTPCIGPILASVLVLAATQASAGALLIAAYCIGFAVPFLLLAAGLASIRRWVRLALPLQRVAGAVLMVMGFLLLTGVMDRLSALFAGWSSPGL